MERRAVLSHSPQEEAVVPLPGPRQHIAPTTALRSTMIVASLRSIRSAGYFEAYSAALTDHRDEILSCVAGTWLPMPAALAHYRACDALDLSASAIVALVSGDGASIRRSLVAAILKPTDAPVMWESLSKLPQVWSRHWQGGAVAVFRLGASDARIEYVGSEALDIRYLRLGIRATIVHFMESAGVLGTVTPLRQETRGESHYRVRWC